MGAGRAHRTRARLIRQGDIWLVGLDPAEGNEQQGCRPVLVVSADAFNRLKRVPIVLPITRGGRFARTAGFAVRLAGTRTQGVVRCDQPCALDLEARGGRRPEAVPRTVLAEVLARLLPILEQASGRPRPARPLSRGPGPPTIEASPAARGRGPERPREPHRGRSPP